jgi:hypothetical protein
MPVSSVAAPNIVGNKPNVQQAPSIAIQQQLTQQNAYPIPSDAQNASPIVCSPEDNVPVGVNGEPIVNSPQSGPMFSQADFSSYLNDIDNSINECRGMVSTC